MSINVGHISTNRHEQSEARLMVHGDDSHEPLCLVQTSPLGQPSYQFMLILVRLDVV